MLLNLMFRFGHTMSSSKWSRLCQYSEQLNLRPYMSENQGVPIIYQLYGVVNHYGYTCQSGHYICMVRSPVDGWVKYNDERVCKCCITFDTSRTSTE